MNFSNYYKKISFKLQIFTFYRLIIERLQNGYKYALCNFYKNVNFLSFDINEEKGYNTTVRAKRSDAAFFCCLYTDNIP